MSDYTPTTKEVREAYAVHRFNAYAKYREVGLPEFDRWLAAYDAQVREQAAQRVAADIRANNGCYDLGDTHIESIVAAARKEDTLLHADNCDRILGCTCGTRIEIVRGGEQA